MNRDERQRDQADRLPQVRHGVHGAASSGEGWERPHLSGLRNAGGAGGHRRGRGGTGAHPRSDPPALRMRRNGQSGGRRAGGPSAAPLSAKVL